MRSRFSAFALEDVDHVLATTHPSGPQFQADRSKWQGQVRAFSRGTEFQGLEVRSSGGEGDEGWVVFHARLVQDGKDASFMERSRFLRVDGRWLYHSGDVQ